MPTCCSTWSTCMSVDPEKQIEAVRSVLEEIGADRVPEFPVFNKIDRASVSPRLAQDHPGSVEVSARDGIGIDELLQALGDRLRVADRVVELVVPYGRGDVLAAVHREGEVVDSQNDEGATVVQSSLDEAGRARFKDSRSCRAVPTVGTRFVPPRIHTTASTSSQPLHRNMTAAWSTCRSVRRVTLHRERS